jgi:hypothetical protein
MRRTVLIALVLAACGTWSNEDLEYLYALPQPDALKSQLSTTKNGTTSMGLSVGDPSMTYNNTKTSSDQFNAFIDQTLAGLDLIRSIPPTTRGKSSRIWGPYDDKNHPGFEVQVTITKESDTKFQWQLDERPKGGDFFTIGGGEFFPTVSLRKGFGHFGFNGKLIRDKLGGGMASEPDTVEIRYKTDADPLMVEMDWTKDDAGSVGYGYNGYADQSAVLGYLLTVPSNTVASKISVSAGWNSKTAGRADILILEGVYAGATEVECWDEAHTVVYGQGYTDGGMYVVGDAGSCVTVPELKPIPDAGP